MKNFENLRKEWYEYVYNEGDEDFINLVNRDDLDAVIVATPWEWHHPMAVAAMKSGKHVGLGVSAAITVEEVGIL